MQYIKWFFLAISVGSLVLAGVMIWQHEPQPLPAQSKQEVSEAASQARVEKPLLVERKGEKLIWRLQAETARQEEGVMILIHPKLELFTEQQEVVEVQGDKAWFEPLQRNITFRGQVRTNFHEWILTSQQLRYQSAQDTLVIQGAFELNSPDTKVRGRGLTANRKTQEIFIAQHAWVCDEGHRKLGHGL